MQVYRCQSERQERAVTAGAEQRRPGGNNDLEHADSETRLAEHRDHLESTYQDPSGTERNGRPSACLRQGDNREEIQEPENRI